MPGRFGSSPPPAYARAQTGQLPPARSKPPPKAADRPADRVSRAQAEAVAAAADVGEQGSALAALFAGLRHGCGDVRDLGEPTDCPPGSEGKILAMQLRVSKRQQLFHPRDAAGESLQTEKAMQAAIDAEKARRAEKVVVPIDLLALGRVGEANALGAGGGR